MTSSITFHAEIIGNPAYQWLHAGTIVHLLEPNFHEQPKPLKNNYSLRAHPHHGEAVRTAEGSELN